MIKVRIMQAKHLTTLLMAFLIPFVYDAAPVYAQFDPKKPKIPFSDQAVEKAIEKAVEYLLSAQEADGTWMCGITKPLHGLDNEKALSDKVYRIGTTALVSYSLLEKGLSIKDSRLSKALAYLTQNEVENFPYSNGLRPQVWLRAYKQDPKGPWRKQLEKEVNQLVKCVSDEGTYFYFPDNHAAKFSGPGDNSNSQYGVLGVWAGYRANMEIPLEYWKKILEHWIKDQNPDGSWPYNRSWKVLEGGGTMTTAGLATLFVCIDATMGEKFLKCNVQNEFAPVKKGLEWMDKNFAQSIADSTSSGSSPLAKDPYYYLYGVERVGLASGYKYFGDVDWYHLGALALINLQQEDGSWPNYHSYHGAVVNTAYALLFLIRGQRGVLFNRLEYDGDWNNRPRALANFCRWAESVWENEVNWQIITLKSSADEWHDAPVVAITGSKAPKFSNEDLQKLRTYVYQGGVLFSSTECGGSAAFGKGMKEVYRKLFPKYELTAASKEHLIYTCQYKLPGMPAFSIVSNGIRPLAIHTEADLPVSWQSYAVGTGRPNFEAAANMLMYVTDRQLKNRGANRWPGESAGNAAKTIKIARIRYAGNYDPEPLALERFARLMSKSYSAKVDYQSMIPASSPASGPDGELSMPATGIPIGDLNGDIKLAVLTGTSGFRLEQEDKDILKKWVAQGGILFLDAAGGSKGFADSARDLIAELWGADSLLPLPVSSPVYQIKDMTVDKVRYRKITRARLGGIQEPHLMAVLEGDRPMVIFSPEDITGALVGCNAMNMDGYESESAFNLMRNIVFYAATAPPVSSQPAQSQPAVK